MVSIPLIFFVVLTASSGCNPSRYISGQCGGPSRFFVLAGGNLSSPKSQLTGENC